MRKMGSCLKTLNTKIRRSTFKSGWKCSYIKIKVIPFRKRLKSQIANELFKIFKIATYKQPTYNICGEQIDEILGEFYEQ